MKKILIYTLLFLSLNANSQKSIQASYLKFCEYLEGEYSSQAQSKEDTTYFNISLVIIPIWADRADGKWYYVEQAMAAKKEKPYRQRVYQIMKGKSDTIISVIYGFDSALQYAGAHKNASIMSKLTYEKIASKLGCEVYMVPESDHSYKGGTIGMNCSSKINDAAYTTTNVQVFNDRLVSWDRGYDKKGEQVWGAELGGYIFDKINIKKDDTDLGDSKPKSKGNTKKRRKK